MHLVSNSSVDSSVAASGSKAPSDAVDGSSPPDETDGPPGAVAMASMLQALGKQVTLVTDRRALQMYQDIMKEAVRTGDHWNSLEVTGSHWRTSSVTCCMLYFPC